MNDGKPEIIARKRHSRWMRYRIGRRIRGAIWPAPRYAATFERFKEGISGALPSAAEGGVIVAACDDYYYRHFAVTLILSIERLGRAQRVHLHLCAPTQEAEDHIERLAGSLKHVTMTWTIDQCLLAEGLRYRTIYYAAARFLIASSIMEAARSPVLCIDVDSVAALPVWPTYDEVRTGADVLVIRRPEEPRISRKILASAVGMNFTPEGRRFAAGLARSLAAILPLKPKYHVDQIAIHMLIAEMTKAGSLRVADMPPAFADHEFGADSVIWTTKGWSRKESAAYLRLKQEVAGLAPDLHDVGSTASTPPNDWPLTGAVAVGRSDRGQG